VRCGDCEEEREFRIVNIFNHESDAWQWITEQDQARAICARLEGDGPRKRKIAHMHAPIKRSILGKPEERHSLELRCVSWGAPN
jgi:hypothetical protein